MVWQEFPSDVPRYQGTARRLLVEGQRTNTNRNARAEGASGATPPTHWVVTLPPGVTATYSPFTRNGVDGVNMELAGTTSGAARVTVSFEVTRPVAASGQSWTNSFFFIETVPNANITMTDTVVVGETAGGTFVESAGFDFTAARGVFARRAATIAMANASTERAAGRFRTNVISSGVDVTGYRCWFGWPQLEQGAFVATPALAAIGVPATSTRGSDFVSDTLANLGIGDNGACTLLATFMIPQSTPASVFPALLHVAGTAGNFVTLSTQATTTIYGHGSIAGVPGPTPGIGAFTAGVPFRIGMSISGTGAVSFSLDGAAVVTAASGCPTSGLTTLTVGNTPIGGGPLFGEVGFLRAIAAPVSGADLQRLVLELPL